MAFVAETQPQPCITQSVPRGISRFRGAEIGAAPEGGNGRVRIARPLVVRFGGGARSGVPLRLSEAVFDPGEQVDDLLQAQRTPR
jgi:hypothetical protein